MQEVGATEDASAHTAAAWYMEDLRGLIPWVRKHLTKAQEADTRSIDARVAEKNKDLQRGDWVTQASHARKKSKLSNMTLGPYMILRTDGLRFTVESPTGIRALVTTSLGRHRLSRVTLPRRKPMPPVRSLHWHLHHPLREMTRSTFFRKLLTTATTRRAFSNYASDGLGLVP